MIEMSHSVNRTSWSDGNWGFWFATVIKTICYRRVSYGFTFVKVVSV